MRSTLLAVGFSVDADGRESVLPAKAQSHTAKINHLNWDFFFFYFFFNFNGPD